MKNTILVFLLCSLLAPATHGSARNPESEKDTYTNPVRTTDGEVLQVADPFVYEYKGTYYMTGTTAGDCGFDYYTSKDLVTWEYGGPLFRKSAGHFGAGAFWAPEENST